MALSPENPQSNSGKSRADQLAERKALQQDVFLREVDDALREDQLMNAIRRYGKPLGAVVVAGLLALAGYLWYSANQSGKADATGEAMVKALDALDASDLSGGDKQLADIAKAGGGYGAAARILQAGIAEQQGKQADAAKQFAAIAADSSVPQAYRDLATLREISASFDTMKPEDVVARLKPMATPGNPWFGSAGELVGIAYMKMGKNDLAGAMFASLAKDKDVPDTMRRRARQLAGLLGVDAIDDPEKAAISVDRGASQ